MNANQIKICMHDGYLTTEAQCHFCGCSNSLRSLSTILKANYNIPVRLFRMLDIPDFLSIRNVKFCYNCGDIQLNSNNKVCKVCGSKELIPLKDTL